jgi:hypothetical protein
MRLALSCLSCIAGLCAALAASAGERVLLQVPLLFEPNPVISEAAKLECGGMASHVGKRIFQTLRDEIPEARELNGRDSPGDDPVLKLWISDLRGIAQDGLQASWRAMVQTIVIRAELHQGPRLIVARSFQRGASALSAPGACEVAGHIAAVLGKDLAAWLPEAVKAASAAGKEPATQESAAAAVESPLLIQVPVLFEPGSSILEPAKSECDVSRKVGTSVFRNVKRLFRDARPIDEPATNRSAHVLKLTIMELGNVRAGPENTGRSIKLRADLLRDAKVVASHTFDAKATRSLTAPCLNVDSAAQVLGQDLVTWLQPVFTNARAGAPR